MNSEVDYTVAVTVFWAVEIVYHDSFACSRKDNSKTLEDLKETC